MGLYLLIVLFANAGMFVASTGITFRTDCLGLKNILAYLPSTFAMYGVTLAHAFSMETPSKRRTIKMFSIIGVTAILSWPFALGLSMTLAIHDIVQKDWSSDRLLELIKGVLSAVGFMLFLLVTIQG